MKTQSWQRPAIATVYFSVVPLLTCLITSPIALAQQIQPNPNPSDNSILIGFDDLLEGENDELFTNLGEILIESGSLTNNRTLTNLGTITVIEPSDDAGFTNRGTVFNQGEFSAVRAFAGLLNQGEFYNLPTGKLSLDFASIENEGYFENSGLIAEDFEVSVLYNKGIFVNEGNLNRVSLDSNTGIFVNRDFHDTDGVDADNFVNEASGTILNDGFTIVRTNQDKDPVPGFENLGLLKGSGVFSTHDPELPFLLGPGTVAPGGAFASGVITDTVGTLTFIGDVVANSGYFDFSFDGFEAGMFDMLNILAGTASFQAATVKFSKPENFDFSLLLQPGETKSFSFLKAEKGIQNFDAQVDFSGLTTPGFQFAVDQQENALVLRATRQAEANPTVPEPALGWAVLVLGGLATRYGRGRTKPTPAHP